MDPDTGALVWDGESLPVVGRESLRQLITELGARVAELEAMIEYTDAGSLSIPPGQLSQDDAADEIVIGRDATGHGDATVTIGGSENEVTYLTGLVRAGTGLVLPAFTVGTLPSAAAYIRGVIYVSDGTGNKRLAVSDGTNWRFPDGNIVS